jgi:hypothetical protein
MITMPATEEARVKLVLTTLAGSITPAANRSSTVSVRALKPKWRLEAFLI